MKDPLFWLMLIPALVAGIILLDRFLLYCERRGWIYWRKSQGTAVSARNAALHMQSLIEPGKTYQIEEERSEREEEDGEGAPPAGKGRKEQSPSKPAVILNEEMVRFIVPDGTEQRMPWSALRAVAIETNDQGPWAEDFYFLLFSDSKEHFCSIPQCAEDSGLLIERLQQLPGFNSQAVIEASGCTTNHLFLCWENRPWIGENWPAIVAERKRRDGNAC